MRASLLILLTACWTSSVAPVPPVAMAPSASCELHEGAMSPAGMVVLSVHGVQFARVDGAIGRLDVTVKGNDAWAEVENTGVSLAGELDLDDLPVRPREIELRDGWLEVSRATAKRAKDGLLEIDVELPPGIEPQTVTLDVKCDQLTFAMPVPVQPAPHLEVVELVHGTTKLRRTIDGKVVGTAGVPHINDSGESIEGHVIERRDASVRMRIPADNPVVVWVPRTAITEPSEGFGVGRFLKDVGRGGDAAITCTQALPLYVSVRGLEQQVGTLKANVGARTRGAVEHGHVGIELGGRDVAPYIKDLATCTIEAE